MEIAKAALQLALYAVLFFDFCAAQVLIFKSLFL